MPKYHHKNIRQLATETFKVLKGLCPEIVKELLCKTKVPISHSSCTNSLTFAVRSMTDFYLRPYLILSFNFSSIFGILFFSQFKAFSGLGHKNKIKRNLQSITTSTSDSLPRYQYVQSEIGQR